MNQEDSKGKVEETKSDEELTQLLEKFEKTIVGSITKGIAIADNFCEESTSSQAQDFSEGVNKLQRNKREAGITPNLFSTDLEGRKWEYLNPIVLYKNNWMGARTQGIRLEKGTYKIEYKVSAIASKGTGLAFFNEDTKKVEKLLFWQLGSERSESIISVSGSQYLTTNSPGIINITNIKGDFNPVEGESIYILTIFRLNTYPD